MKMRLGSEQHPLDLILFVSGGIDIFNLIAVVGKMFRNRRPRVKIFHIRRKIKINKKHCPGNFWSFGGRKNL